MDLYIYKYYQEVEKKIFHLLHTKIKIITCIFEIILLETAEFLICEQCTLLFSSSLHIPNLGARKLEADKFH